jgi:hypothetical protein
LCFQFCFSSEGLQPLTAISDFPVQCLVDCFHSTCPKQSSSYYSMPSPVICSSPVCPHLNSPFGFPGWDIWSQSWVLSLSSTTALLIRHVQNLSILSCLLAPIQPTPPGWLLPGPGLPVSVMIKYMSYGFNLKDPTVLLLFTTISCLILRISPHSPQSATQARLLPIDLPSCQASVSGPLHMLLPMPEMFSPLLLATIFLLHPIYSHPSSWHPLSKTSSSSLFHMWGSTQAILPHLNFLFSMGTVIIDTDYWFCPLSSC